MTTLTSTSDPVYPSDEWQRQYMRRLEVQIREWKDEYYNALPSVDDRTYDLWWFNLLHLESKYPHLMNPNSVTQTVGSPKRP